MTKALDAAPEDWSLSSPQHRCAAVLAPLLWQEQGWQVVLIRRPDHLRDHPGQVAMPGGKRDAEDATPLQTALRECWEELAIPAEALHLLGAIEPEDTQTTGFRLFPLFGVLAPHVKLQPDPREVADILFVPLAELWRQNERAQWQGPDGPGEPSYLWQGVSIWGATARILHRFMARLSAISARTSHEISGLDHQRREER
uniref:Putative NUDIX hydrolase n=1 Tax=Magnetococcus massalia (strain MO-1) TaxID=451514 RepID=A0A1S7LF96_MAGMO|nr:putative NUDIX hydrolase [Candidatus Magnetococcus massalia]